jgi:hypothetical protein
MRGDAMAVGDICAVSCGARGKSDTSGGDDCRAAGRKREQRVVRGHRRAECDAASQPSRDGVGVDDGTRIEHGVGCTYSSGQGGADGMQGDGVAVRDVCAVSCGTRGKRDTSGGDDGRAESGTCKPRVVGGHRRTECDAANEPSWDRVVVDDGTWIEHGDGFIHTAGQGGALGMRGDAVAVGDVCAVSCGAQGKRDTSGGDDGREAGRKREQGVVGGHRRTECDAASQPSRDGLSIDDGTRIEHGDGCTHGSGQGGALGMRGDAVAVGDVCAVSCGTRGKRDTSGGDDGRGAGRKREQRVVRGHRRTECDAANEPSRDRLSVDDGTRIEHGDSCIHTAGQGGAHGMRGD